MPATERSFTHIPPLWLYLDTNVVLDYLVSTRVHHARAEALFLHLEDHQLTTLYISTLSWIEFTGVIRQQSFRDALPPEDQAHYELARWQEAPVRNTYIDTFCGFFVALLTQFGATELEVTPDVWTQALDYVKRYNLRPQDAVHLACAFKAGVVDLASFDRGFRTVDGLYLWNDRIYN